jgi:hypothetical protein
MTGRERALSCARRTGPDRTPYLRWDNFALSDILAAWARKAPKPAPTRREWTDEWGCRWESLDTTAGHVVGHPIRSAAGYASYRIPKVELDLPGLRANRTEYPDRLCSGGLGFFFFERLEKLREFREAMVDLAAEREALGAFLDRLQAYYVEMVDAYATSGTVEVICVNEDLGLQDRLTISPTMWREVFKPRYKAVYDRAHEHGMLVFHHSCGHIQPIISDLAEIAVDFLEMQQLSCMNMQAVAEARGRICVTAPVDIQAVLPTGDWKRVEEFQRRLFRVFDRPEGGFMPQIYSDLASLGVRAEIGERLERLILRLCDWRKRGEKPGNG